MPSMTMYKGLGRYHRRGRPVTKKQMIVVDPRKNSTVKIVHHIRGGRQMKLHGPRDIRFQELKYFDGQSLINVVEPPQTWAVLNKTGTLLEESLNAIPRGTSEIDRIGSTVIVRSIQIKGRFRLTNQGPGSAHTVSAAMCRLAIVLDRSNNKTKQTTTVIGEVFQDLFSATSKSDIYSNRNLLESNRFIVLWDKTFAMNQDIAGDNGLLNFSGLKYRSFNFRKKVHIPIQFDSQGTPGPADLYEEITSNNLLLIGWSDNSGQVTVEYMWRLRFDG